MAADKGNITTVNLFLKNMNVVNSYEISNNPSFQVFLFLITVVVNSWAIAVIRKKDVSGLNRMLMADCGVNMLWSPLVRI